MHSKLRNAARRILVVDDNQAIHDDFRKILAAKGPADASAALEEALFGEPVESRPVADFDLSFAFQGQEACELVQRAQQAGRPFAMAFVDVRMPPGLDGIETTARLWELQPDLQVVICTAFSDYSWDEMVAKLGHSDRLLILKKPFDNVEALQLASALTEKWRLTREARARVDDLEATVQERTAKLVAALEQQTRDLAAQRQLEAQLARAQKLEAIGQLAGGVAHDYNNILTATLAHLGLLLEQQGLTDETRFALTELEQMAHRAAGLTRQLLAFGRQQVVQMRALDLNQVLGNLFVMLRRLLGENIELDFRPVATPLWLEADAGMVEQVVTNLCVNARDAMSPRGGRLTVETSHVVVSELDACANPDARPGAFVRLSVTDTGCGMDAATQARIFEPFFTTKEVGKGTGLGLATVYGITKQHQGWVEVQSAVGRGTTFLVYFPAKLRSSPTTIADVAADPRTTSGDETILVVEDEEAVRLMVSLTLRKRGYRVLESSDGAAAIEQWSTYAHKIDLLLTDMVMPNGVSGLELAEHFRQSNPAVKIIVTSGYSAELSRAGVAASSGFGYLGKPYEVNDLTSLVRRCLDQAQPSRDEAESVAEPVTGAAT